MYKVQCYYYNEAHAGPNMGYLVIFGPWPMMMICYRVKHTKTKALLFPGTLNKLIVGSGGGQIFTLNIFKHCELNHILENCVF